MTRRVRASEVEDLAESVVHAYYYLAERLGVGAGYEFVRLPTGPYSAELSRDLRTGKVKPLKALALVELVALVRVVLSKLKAQGVECNRSIVEALAESCELIDCREVLRGPSALLERLVELVGILCRNSPGRLETRKY